MKYVKAMTQILINSLSLSNPWEKTKLLESDVRSMVD